MYKLPEKYIYNTQLEEQSEPKKNALPQIKEMYKVWKGFSFSPFFLFFVIPFYYPFLFFIVDNTGFRKKRGGILIYLMTVFINLFINLFVIEDCVITRGN